MIGSEKMKENWKLHDLAIVARQPKMQTVQIKGLIAVITEIEGEYATITELQLSGQADGGTGAVELACLEKPNKLSGPMRAAYAVYKQNILRYEEDMLQYEQDKELRRKQDKKLTRKSITLVAKNNSIEPKLLHKMLKDLHALGTIKYYGQ